MKKITALILSLAIGMAQIIAGLCAKFVTCIKNGDKAGAFFDAGLWISKAKREAILEEKRNKDTKGRDFTELSVNDYLERRSCPILIIYPIDLKTEIYSAERTAWGVRVDELEKLKIEIKSNIGEDTPLMAFAVGFPKKESGVTVTYRANKIKLDQLNANLEVDDDEEGVEDDDD